VWRALRAHPWAWLRCSAIGFVLLFLLLAYAAASGPAWLVARPAPGNVVDTQVLGGDRGA
jgi:hypothetical protein